MSTPAGRFRSGDRVVVGVNGVRVTAEYVGDGPKPLRCVVDVLLPGDRRRRCTVNRKKVWAP